MKSCHLSFLQTMRPVFMFSISTYLLAVIIIVYALPWGNLAYKQKTYDIIKNRASINIKPNVFNYDFEGLVILAKERRGQFRLVDIMMSDKTQPTAPRTQPIAHRTQQTAPRMETIASRTQFAASRMQPATYRTQ